MLQWTNPAVYQVLLQKLQDVHLMHIKNLQNKLKLAKYIDADGQTRVARVEGDSLLPVRLESGQTLGELIATDNPIATVDALPTAASVPISEATHWLPPIDNQEVWAAGVTYKRSQTARMEESEAAASCYDRVYQADRPEIFFKAPPHRAQLRYP